MAVQPGPEGAAPFTHPADSAIMTWISSAMVNYLLLLKIRKVVKTILKEKIEDDEIATTPKSCLGCLADDISWEVYYLFKDRDKDAETRAE